jgi:hypothetical protein
MEVTRTLRLIFAATFTILTLGVGFSAHGAEMRITEMAVTTKIAKNKPIDAVRRISSTSVRQLYCFTRLTWDSDQETVIRHAWYHNGKLERETELPVKGRRWRTYSKREVTKESVGEWRVDAKDGSGKVIKSVEFRIN